MQEVVDRITQFIKSAWAIKNYTEYDKWIRYVLAFLDSAVSTDIAKAVAKLGGQDSLIFWEGYRDSQAGYLEGLVIRLAKQTQADAVSSQAGAAQNSPRVKDTKTVFLVHGHDVSAKESTARFLEKLQLVPVILHEQANEGRTVIEKFEAHADVGYAVVLLTPDDVGASAASPKKLQGRARQNVILELGYFTGKLGRRRVCGLFKPGVEIPSDFHGVLFIELDKQGAWRSKLAQELVGAGMKIDHQGLLQF